MPTHPHLDGVAFHSGYKTVAGVVIRAIGRRRYTSVSDPSRVPYETITFADATFSCNCRGWISHGRCKHVTTFAHEMGFEPRCVSNIRSVSPVDGVIGVLRRARLEPAINPKPESKLKPRPARRIVL